MREWTAGALVLAGAFATIGLVVLGASELHKPFPESYNVSCVENSHWYGVKVTPGNKFYDLHAQDGKWLARVPDGICALRNMEVPDGIYRSTP